MSGVSQAAERRGNSSPIHKAIFSKYAVRTMTHPPSLQARAYTYTVLLEPDEDAGFVVTCPALPGLVSHGDTIEEAREHAAEAMVLYLVPQGGRQPFSHLRRASGRHAT